MEIEMEASELLATRGQTHGPYELHAGITQQLKAVLHFQQQNGYACWAKLTECQRESLDMIMHKVGRILAGDPDFRDHWDDIAGYAKLVADKCSK
jgi:hypothetical protein